MNHVPENRSLDCAAFEDRIHQILDDRLTLTGDRLLMDHVAACPPCGAKLDDYETVDDSVKLLKDEIDQLLNHHGNQPQSTAHWAGWARTIAVVASLAALIFVLTGVFPTPQAVPNHVENSSRTEPSTPSLAANRQRGDREQTDPIQSTNRHVTPPTSPFSRDFEGYSISQISDFSVSTMAPWSDLGNWQKISSPLFQFSSEFPGVRPIHCSLNVTIDLLKKSFSRPEKTTPPNLGFQVDPQMLTAV